MDNIAELKKQPAAPAVQTPPPPVSPPRPAAAAPVVDDTLPKGSLAMYRELLREFWFDGKISQEEEDELKNIRTLFHITGDEHVALEREIKLQAYINALQTAWTDGVVTENEQKVLETMRVRYSISAEEHRSAETKIEEAKRNRKSNGAILLVDGDMESLSALMGELKRRNYDAMIAHGAADALAALQHRTPDIVISEIFFDGDTSDGFSLFKKLQSLPKFKGIPFFFMTSLIDNKITRAGIRLGIGNIFYKPLDMKLVAAALDRTMQVKV